MHGVLFTTYDASGQVTVVCCADDNGRLSNTAINVMTDKFSDVGPDQVVIVELEDLGDTFTIKPITAVRVENKAGTATAVGAFYDLRMQGVANKACPDLFPPP